MSKSGDPYPGPPDPGTLSDYDYALPEAAIAQAPIEPRDASRLLVLDRRTGAIAHRRFRDLPAYFRPGDALVINDTRVLPARLIGERLPSAGRAELLLLQRRSHDTWEALVRPGRRLGPGVRLRFGGTRVRLSAEILAPTEAGGRLVRFASDEPLDSVLAELGQVPLPPYIKAPLADPARYQTVYAGEGGSAAAPTAGLHFTPGLLAEIGALGVAIVSVTLHVGLGTFRPVQVERIADHRMHAEYFSVSAEAAAELARARGGGGRLVAVGTTTARVLETLAKNGRGAGEENEPARIASCSGWTDLFVTPGHRFRMVDALVTNFHLPRSTLLMLVSALAGRERVLAAYREAMAAGYRFYSFGDAMLIL